MTFPVYLHLFGCRLHPHLVFEALGYAAGAWIYFRARRRAALAPSLETTLWLLVGVVFGAWAGSKLLAWAESPARYLALWRADHLSVLGGKTIVGGLLGGWAGIEIAKWRLGIRQSTGDAFVAPLAVGTAIGRLGCFFTGLDDDTYGVATRLPWGVDFGDGVPRHPTQLYESLFVLGLGGLVLLAARRAAPAWPAGRALRLYLAGYFAFRAVIEFLKPRELLLVPLSAIQCASILGVILCCLTLRRPCPTAPISTPS